MGNVNSDQGLSLSNIANADADFYWVNQRNQAEIEGEYLKAKVNNSWHHDLSRLSLGDVVFHNYEGQLLGCSAVVAESERYIIQGEQYYRVDVDLYWFKESIPINEYLKSELGREELRTNKYYPLDKNNDLTQTYLSDLTEGAANFLIKQAKSAQSAEKTYEIPDTVERIWQMTPGENGKYWNEWKQQGIASIKYDLNHMIKTDFEDKEWTKEDLVEKAVETRKRHGRNMAYRFQFEIEKGDLIIAKQPRHGPNEIYGIGIVTKGHHETTYPDIDHGHFINVDWKQTFPDKGVKVYEIDFSHHMIDDLESETWYELFDQLVEETEIDHEELFETVFSPHIASSLDETLSWDRHRGGNDIELPPPGESVQNINLDKIERQLQNTGQLVFYGPPGTGKTYTAQQFARWWLNHQPGQTPSPVQLETVTFHPSFSYEDFIEGLTAEEKNDGVVYEIKDGVFKEICRRAKHAYEHARDSDKFDEPPRYVLIIDEINRGNLAQIFGETMTLLEFDKRYDQENEIKISLAHSGDSFVVPPNLYVIGTMNTADRSIALVDAALRRRFRFISFPPNYKVIINDYDAFNSLDEARTVAETNPNPYRSLIALSVLAIRGLNERIVDAPDLGKGKQIGHSYLMNLETVDDVLDAWKYEILPLIEEYYFGQFDRIREELFAGSGDRLFHWEQEEIADFTADELRRTLADLEEISLIKPETEASKDTQGTIELLLNEGVLKAGMELVFDESKVPDDTNRPYSSSEQFWRCEITEKTDQSDNVRWLHNNKEYSVSGLAQTILEQISDHSGAITGLDYWRHPEFEDQLLAELPTAVQSRQSVVEKQTTD